MKNETTKRKVRILCPLPDVYAMYQPKVGGVYEADYKEGQRSSKHNSFTVCIIKIRDKHICLKSGEYEILEDA